MPSCPASIRLYRGLKEPFDAARVVARHGTGTDFTDCPFTALLYATGRKGAVLVAEVPAGYRRVSEELFGLL